MEIRYWRNTDPDTAGIYRIYNRCSGKVYVGSTTRSIKKRIDKHEYRLKRGTHSNPHLQNSYNAHDGNWFLGFGLETIKGEEEAVKREQHWLDKHKETGFDLYNINLEVERRGARALVEWNKNNSETKSEIAKKIWVDHREKMLEAARNQTWRNFYDGRWVRGPDAEIHQIDGSVKEFDDKHDISPGRGSRLTMILNEDYENLKMLNGWSDAEKLHSKNKYREIFSYYEFEDVDTGEKIYGETVRDLAEKVGSVHASIRYVFNNQIIHKGRWKPTDYVHPNKTYQQIKKEHEQLTSN